MGRQFINGKEAERIGLVNRAVPAAKLEEEVWKIAKEMAGASPDGIMILKEALNTHAEIMGRGAVFAYHRQLNALGRIGRTESPLNLEKSKARTKESTFHSPSD